MKELSIEQKAKAYDKAVQEAFIAYKDEDKHLKATLERIFPELKESEDERIRKDIIEMLRNWASVHYITKEQFSERMAWLEKQGEQKLAWNEKDEGYMDRILDALYDYYPKSYAQSIYDWLKFLKKSVKGE